MLSTSETIDLYVDLIDRGTGSGPELVAKKKLAVYEMESLDEHCLGVLRKPF